MKRRLVLEAAFGEAPAVRVLLSTLAGAGVEEHKIEVRSPIPFEVDGADDAAPRRRSWVLPAALLGGLLGGSAAFLLSTMTARAYPLVTGGMPIVAGPPVGIVTYEGTALGVILATVGTVLLEGRLLRRSPPGVLDHHIAEGRLVVSLFDVDGEALARARALASQTAVEVRWEGEPEAGQARGS